MRWALGIVVALTLVGGVAAQEQTGFLCTCDVGAALDFGKSGKVKVEEGYFYGKPGGGAWLWPGEEENRWQLVAVSPEGQGSGSASVLFLNTPDGSLLFIEFTPSGVSIITVFVNSPSATPDNIPMAITRSLVLGGTPLVTTFSGSCQVVAK